METTERREAREAPFRLVVSPVSLVGKRVVIDFDARKYGRVKGDLEAIEAGWRRKLAENSRIYNMSKFRLAEVRMEGDEVVLEIGLTDYKEFVGTHLVEERYERRRLSRAIGCEAVARLRDDKIVLLRRSAKVANQAGHYNGPSGHAEPQRSGLEKTEHIFHELMTESILTEIVEETGIPRTALSAPIFLGVMEDATQKPDFLFLVDCDLDENDFRRGFPRAEDAWESDHAIVVPIADLPQLTERLTDVTNAALLCLQERLLL